MKAAVLGLAALAMILGDDVPAWAHHSHPIFYDACTTVTIDGEIDSVQWKNPHVLIDVTDADGKSYPGEFPSAGALDRSGTAPSKVGDHVVITANPMRDAAAIRARFPSLTLNPQATPVVDVIHIRRTSDTWSWARPEPASPDCGGK